MFYGLLLAFNGHLVVNRRCISIFSDDMVSAWAEFSSFLISGSRAHGVNGMYRSSVWANRGGACNGASTKTKDEGGEASTFHGRWGTVGN